jgi:primosomal protein N' (replication factor Y)
VHEAVVRAESDALREAIAFLRRAVEAAPAADEGLVLYDPVPMSLARLAGRERAQVLVQSRSRRALQAFLAAWSQTLYALKPGKVRWHLDVDPIEF